MAPVIKLNSGYDMPQVGFGLWKVDNAIAADVVYNAIKAGYRLFDGACGKLRPPPFILLHSQHHTSDTGFALSGCTSLLKSSWRGVARK